MGELSGEAHLLGTGESAEVICVVDAAGLPRALRAIREWLQLHKVEQTTVFVDGVEQTLEAE